MKPSTFLTAGEAAKLTGKSASTIVRAIKSGRIAGGGKKGANGEYQIDPAALFNVYPMKDEAQERTPSTHPQMEGDAPPQNNAGYEAAIEALKEVIAAKEEIISDKEQTIEDYKDRLAESKNLLTDQREKVEAMEAKPPEKKGIFRRWFR